ncbi:hypothetical protein Tco_1365667 [Tanacetum coccineum]
MKEMSDSLNNLVPELTIAKTNELIKEYFNYTTTTADLQHQLYLKMKLDLQDQVVDPELWDVLKRKFEKSSASTSSCRDDAFRKRDHDEHQGEKSVKRQKISKGSKFAKGSSSKQSVQGSKTSTSECQHQ